MNNDKTPLTGSVAWLRKGPRTGLIISRLPVTVGMEVDGRAVFAPKFDCLGEVDVTIADELVVALTVDHAGGTLPATLRLLLRDWRNHCDRCGTRPFRPKSSLKYRMSSVAEAELARIEAVTGGKP